MPVLPTRPVDARWRPGRRRSPGASRPTPASSSRCSSSSRTWPGTCRRRPCRPPPPTCGCRRPASSAWRASTPGSTSSRGASTPSRCAAGPPATSAGARPSCGTLEDHLGVRAGGTTPDLRHTLETAACFGSCALAPVIVANGRAHGRQTSASARALADGLQRRRAGTGRPRPGPPTGVRLGEGPQLDEPPQVPGLHGLVWRIAAAKERWRRLHGGGQSVVTVGTATCGLAAGAGEVLEAVRSGAGLAGRSGGPARPGAGRRRRLSRPVLRRAAAGHRDAGAAPDRLRARDARRRRGDPGGASRPPRAAGGAGAGERRGAGDPGHPAAGGPAGPAGPGPDRAAQLRRHRPGRRRPLPRAGRVRRAAPGAGDVARGGDRGGQGVRACGAAAAAASPPARSGSSAARPRGPPRSSSATRTRAIPGAFMDRSLLEGDPHAVLEGMAIAAYAIGATRGYVYVRAEYPLAIERLEVALGQMRELGLLGDDILGSGFSFDIDIRQGAGAFVCGEETALIASLEGRRGMPRPRPPYPAVRGLFGRPSNINNVETLANVASILREGAAWFAGFGTATSRGTKTFALTGQDQPARAHRGPDGDLARRGRQRHRRRHRRRRPVQGGADRRPVRRLPPGPAPRPADRLRAPARRPGRSWARAAW